MGRIGMTAAVLFVNGSPLLLADIKESGSDISGYVVNGNWDFELTGNICRAYVCGSRELMNEFPATLDRIVAVPREQNLTDYNAVIAWAEKQ